MKISTGKIIFLITLVALLAVSFSYKKETKVPFNYLVLEPGFYSVNAQVNEPKKPITPPFLGKSINGFKEALAFNESGGNYFVTNQLGYMGKYQFGKETLKGIGVKDIHAFLKDTRLQEKAFIANLERNKWILRREIARYSGRYVGGIKITESGILAAAHLVGPGNIQVYLRSGGLEDYEDGNGISLKYYLKRFAGYDLSMVRPNHASKI